MDPTPQPASIAWTLPLGEEWALYAPPSFPVQADPERALQAGHFVKVVLNRASDPRLHAALILRKGWILYESPQDGSKKGLDVLARLVLSIRGQQAHVAIESVQLARDIAPGDWLMLYLAGQKVTCVAGRQWLTAAGVHEERLGLIKTLGDPWITRLLALKDGDRIYLLRAWCAASVYELLAEEWVLAWHTFELLEPTGEACAEKLVEHRLTTGEAEAATLVQFFAPSALKVGSPSWETPAQYPTPVFLTDPDSRACFCVGLQGRSQDETSGMVLREVLRLWSEPELKVQLEPVVHGPYQELPGEVTGQYFEMPIGSDSDSAGETGAEQAAAAPQDSPPPWRMRAVVVGTQYAWAWILWRPAPPTSTTLASAVDRRAFELLLLYLQVTHPSLAPPPAEPSQPAAQNAAGAT